MVFADIHSHMLFGVDDGARSSKQMCQMLDMAYDDGVRLLCLTPHYHPGYFGENREAAEKAFAELRAYGEKYPDLELHLANELRWTHSAIEWLDLEQCRTLGDSLAVLVDFSALEREKDIMNGLDRLLSAGYEPILAHVERYQNLRGKWDTLEQLKRRGVRLQITAGALTGASGLRSGWHAKELARRKLADFVASDAHDPERRRPEISGAYRWLRKKCEETYADALCYENARALLAAGKE